MTIERRPFGRTGLEIPALTLGGGWVGGIMIHQPEDVRREALRRCLASGVDWIDTAQSYGQGQSETNIGRLLKELPAAQRPRISTKIGLKPEDMSDPKSAVRRAIESSLERLGLEKVVVYQLHNRIGTSDSGWISTYQMLRPGGIADAFAAVKEAGLTDHVGITALGDTDAVRDVIASGRFESAQVYYNLLNPSAGVNVPARYDSTDFRGLLAACAAHGLGVFGIRVMAGGVLASPAPHGREVPITRNAGHDAEVARAAAAWAALGEREEPTAATAIRYALAEPRISSAEFGAAELEHVDIALAAGAAGPLEPAARATLADLLDKGFSR